MSSQVHIGLHNKDPSPREYTVKITEMKDVDMLPKDLGERYQVFDSIFKRDDASGVS